MDSAEYQSCGHAVSASFMVSCRILWIVCDKLEVYMWTIYIFVRISLVRPSVAHEQYAKPVDVSRTNNAHFTFAIQSAAGRKLKPTLTSTGKRCVYLYIDQSEHVSEHFFACDKRPR